MLGELGVALAITLACGHIGTVFALTSLVRLHWTTFGDSILILIPVSVLPFSVWRLTKFLSSCLVMRDEAHAMPYKHLKARSPHQWREPATTPHMSDRSNCEEPIISM
jgi:hypothetical protein